MAPRAHLAPARPDARRRSTAALALVAAALACGVGDAPATGGGAADDATRWVAPAGEDLRVELALALRLGGRREDQLRDVRVLADGAVVAAGYTRSDAEDFPGATRLGPLGGDMDALVVRFDAAGRLVWLTLLGGSRKDFVTGFDVAADGSVALAGGTGSRDFPVTRGAFDPRFRGGGLFSEYADAWAARLSADGRRLAWATFLGGSDDEAARGGVALDPAGRPVVYGWTRSADFLARGGAGAPSPAPTRIGGWSDMFVLGLAADGASLRFVRLLGSPSDSEPEELVRGVVFEPDGGITAVGTVLGPGAETTPDAEAGDYRGGRTDVYLARLAPDGRVLRYASHLGGAGEDHAHHPLRDAAGAVYLTGFTSSRDLPVRLPGTPGPPGAYAGGAGDHFLARLGPDLRIRLLGYFGGSGDEGSHGNALAPPGFAGAAEGLWALYGTTGSSDLPRPPGVAAGAPGSSLGGSQDAYLALFDPVTGTPRFVTHFGGSGWERGSGVAFGGSDRLAAVGATDSADFPVTAGAHRPERAGGRDATLAVFRIGRIENQAGSRSARPAGTVPTPARRAP